MRYFNFNNLIDKYTVDFTAINSGVGGYDDLGEWVAATPVKTDMRGAIIGISETKIYRSDGVLTEKDKELYMKEPLGPIDKAYILYDGNKYRVEANPQNNSQFTGVFQYTLKWISAFKEGDKLD